MTAINIPCPACGSVLKVRDRSLLGRRGKCPKCSHSFVLEEPEEVELELAPPPQVGQAARWIPDTPAAQPAFPPVQTTTAPGPFIAAAEVTGADRLRALRKQKGKRRGFNLAIGLIVAVVGGGLGYYVWTQPADNPSIGPRVATNVAPNGVGTSTGGGTSTEAGVAASPTQGEPILLEMVPAGPRVLLHLRPAELWQPESLGEEFRFCLGPVGTFLEAQIKALCQRPPQDIEEVLFAWIPGQRGTPPDLTTIVRLKTEAKKSELLEALGGERIDTYGQPVYVNGDRAAFILNLKTYAIGPASMAEEMVNSVGGQSPLPAGVEDLIRKTDRTRHITLLFEPTAVLLDKEFLAPSTAQPLLTQCMDWFGDDAETVLWSLHLDPERFYSEVVVRSSTGIRPAGLEARLKEKVNGLAGELLGAVKYMQPQEVGKRQMIGRVPAMAKVFAMATLTEHDPRHVKLITALPDRAAPNLALGTLLAWDESTRTDFQRILTPTTPSSSSKLPTTVAERLKQKIPVDFRRTPLQEAFAYIADETKVTIDIDGDALKLSGYTQNMPQSFQMEMVPATEAIQGILKNYDKMCIVVDETRGQITVTTYPVAEQKRLTPFKLTP
ncbi:MAG: hypothetical protein SH850_29325 [Planctomycetaceae bacterium]|nr:hypothetical protein [Planctomycetaceae bacterium]